MTTQMKAVDYYFLLVVFTLLLNAVLSFATFMFNLDRKHGSERVKGISQNTHTILQNIRTYHIYKIAPNVQKRV